MRKIASFVLKLCVVVFYAVALFFTLADIFPEEMYRILFEIYPINNDNYYDIINVSEIKENSKYKEKYGVPEMILGEQYYDPQALYLKCFGGSSETEIFIQVNTPYMDFCSKPTIEIMRDGQWNEITYSVIDTVIDSSYYTINSVINNGDMISPKIVDYNFYLNKLPQGSYRATTVLFDITAAVYFEITKPIKTFWSLNKREILDSTLVKAKVYTSVDTKWFYIGIDGSGEPVFIWKYRIFKNGKWQPREWWLNYHFCGTGLNSYIHNENNYIYFNDKNSLFSVLTWGYWHYLRKNKLVDPTFDPDEYSLYSSQPKDISFVYSDLYKTFFNETIGDSLEVQLSFDIYPMQWSSYEEQEVFSPVYKFSAKEIYEAFENNLKRLVPPISKQ